MRTARPVVITACANESWLWPSKGGGPDTGVDLDELIAESVRCKDAGAAVMHVHTEGVWAEAIDGIRAKTDLLVQCGMSTLPKGPRMAVFEHKAEMISIMLAHHDEAFANVQNHELHPREELVDYAMVCREHGVKPECEIWHSGSIWNLEYLKDGGHLDEPVITTLFFGWPGGTWSPPTVEEYLYRRKLMPSGCVSSVSVMGEHQREVHTIAVQMGDHLRVGTEDWPFNRAGERASTSELVAEAAEMVELLGGRVATVAEARELMGL